MVEDLFSNCDLLAERPVICVKKNQFFHLLYLKKNLTHFAISSRATVQNYDRRDVSQD